MKIKVFIGVITFVLVVWIAFLLKSPKKEELVDFWAIQRKGTNFFNRIEQRERLVAAKELGLSWIRLTPSKWECANSELQKGDFLLGLRDNYSGLVAKDLEHLLTVLNWAKDIDLKIVLTFLNLPGGYWKQHNGGIQDRRLWMDKSQWFYAAKFMKDLVKALHNHSALAGIDVYNEPSPEQATGVKFTDWSSENYQEWARKIKDAAQDLNSFYRMIHSAIREVDSSIPIIFESGFYATPWALTVLEPIDDNNVLYSFHMYEPFAYTFNHLNKEVIYQYPGEIPFGEIKEKRTVAYWDKNQIDRFFQPILDWQKMNKIPSSRIIVGEFGVNRFQIGAEKYFLDLINKFDQESWHWAFYSFREDEWDIMDYELGKSRPLGKYWQAIEQGKIPEYKGYKSEFIDVIKSSLGKISN